MEMCQSRLLEKSGLLSNHHTLPWEQIVQTAHELSAWIGLAICEKAVVLKLGILRPLHVQTELKGHLLIWPKPVKQRNRRAECLKIQVTDREFDSLEKSTAFRFRPKPQSSRSHMRTCAKYRMIWTTVHSFKRLVSTRANLSVILFN